MYNSSGATLSTKNKFIKIVPAKKKKKQKKNEKISDLGMLQSFAKSMNGFSTGERSPEGGQRNLESQSSKFPLQRKEEKEEVEEDFTPWGQGRLYLWVFAMKVRQQSIYLSSKPRF